MKKSHKNIRKDQRGLTLVELLAVVVILAIVAAIAFVLIGNVIENSRKDAHIANAQQAIAAAKLAEASGDAFTSETDNIIDFASDDEENKVKEYLGEITYPWKDDENAEDGKYTSIQVEKTDEGYKVTLAPNPNDCTIEGKTESDLQAGRDKACE